MCFQNRREQFDLFLYTYKEQLAQSSIGETNKDEFYCMFKEHLAFNETNEDNKNQILDHFILFLSYHRYTGDIKRYVAEWRAVRKARSVQEAEQNARMTDFTVTTDAAQILSYNRVVRDLNGL